MRLFPFILCLAFVSTNVFAVAIQLTKNRDMLFATSSPGDGAAIINPGDAASSKYTVTGNAFATFDITFPSGTINMVNGANTIGTTTWTSDVTSPGTLDGGGTATIYIGATRDALGAGQASGSYSATHSVSVQYSGGVGLIRTVAANHTVVVVPSISLTNLTGISFPDAARDDAAATVAPGASSASYTVTGEAGYVYTVSLPADGTIVMETAGGGSADKEIAVNTFTSSPSGTGTIGGGGTDTLYVGGTRAAIRNTQTQGNYTGSFLVTVTYQ